MLVLACPSDNMPHLLGSISNANDAYDFERKSIAF